MNTLAILPTQLFSTYTNHLVLDVRSPAEFAKGHIPKAVNVPLFSNEERKIIGTLYKQKSKQIAIEQGILFFKANMLAIIEQVQCLQPLQNQSYIIVHCARGGMRSAAICWLLEHAGWQVKQLTAGYKSFRNWCLQQFATPHQLKIIGGFTGSGKTDILQQLHFLQENVVDLEALAKHKGSAFGGIDMPQQPTQEQFENNLAKSIFNCNGKPFYIEDESNRIGNVMIPLEFWNQMRKTKVLFLQIPFSERLTYLVQEYGSLPLQQMEDAIKRIAKRLGGLQMQQCLAFLKENKIMDCFAILLVYYDKHYLLAFEKRENSQHLKIEIPCSFVNPIQNSHILLQLTQ